MLRPGTRITYDGAPGTVERVVGPGEVIVRTSKGKFVVHERFCAIVRTPEAPGAPTPSSAPPVSVAIPVDSQKVLASPASTPVEVKEAMSKAVVTPDFESMTKKELSALAVAKGFDVKGATKADIIAALRE